MNAVDTNILIYSLDRNEPLSESARFCVSHCWSQFAPMIELMPVRRSRQREIAYA